MREVGVDGSLLHLDDVVFYIAVDVGHKGPPVDPTVLGRVWADTVVPGAKRSVTVPKNRRLFENTPTGNQEVFLAISVKISCQ